MQYINYMFHEFKVGDRIAFVRQGQSIWDHTGELIEPRTVCYIGTLVRYLGFLEVYGKSWRVILEDNTVLNQVEQVQESQLIPIPKEASENQIKALKGLLQINYV
jgi:hypothetical protein